jgi:hypothetical protein
VVTTRPARLLPVTLPARLALVALVVALVADWAATAAYRPDAQPDLAEYHSYALGFLAHHTLPQEYPPLAIAAFLLTLAPPLTSYPLVFGAWMLGLVFVAYVLTAREFGPARGLALLAYLVAGAAATVLSRFDIVPALLVLTAFLALRRERWWACYSLLAAGTLFKLFPLFLVPLVVIDHLNSARLDRQKAVRRALMGLGAYSGIVLAGFGLAALIDPTHALAVLSYAASRPFELESAPATMLWLGSFVGQPVHALFSYGSYNLVADGEHFLGLAATGALIAGLAYVYARLWTRRIEAGRAWIASLCVVVLTSKVLSAQYLIWIFPLVAATEGLSATWVLIALATSLVFPVLFAIEVIDQGGGRLSVGTPLLVAIAVRNALLVVGALQAGVFVKPSLPKSP